jgi:hypothetical protein
MSVVSSKWAIAWKASSRWTCSRRPITWKWPAASFYLCLGAQPMLDSGYTVFGQTIEGKDVIGQLRVGDVIEGIEIENAAE